MAAPGHRHALPGVLPQARRRGDIRAASPMERPREGPRAISAGRNLLPVRGGSIYGAGGARNAGKNLPGNGRLLGRGSLRLAAGDGAQGPLRAGRLCLRRTRAPQSAAASQSGSRASSNRFRIDETAPARAAERLPLPFRLGEAIRDRIDGRRIVAESAVTAVHLDAFAPGCALLDAALPGADAVASAVDGARGHRRRLGKRTREGDPLIVDAVSAG